MGASLGGIYAGLIYSLALSDDPQWTNLKLVDSLVASVAGGPISDVLATSNLETLKKIREDPEDLIQGPFHQKTSLIIV